MSDDKDGALLVKCLSCGAEWLPIRWHVGLGWCCASCERGIHGPDQRPQIDVTGEGDQQMDLF